LRQRSSLSGGLPGGVEEARDDEDGGLRDPDPHLAALAGRAGARERLRLSLPALCLETELELEPEADEVDDELSVVHDPVERRTLPVQVELGVHARRDPQRNLGAFRPTRPALVRGGITRRRRLAAQATSAALRHL
jgi:hypothetical protein